MKLTKQAATPDRSTHAQRRRASALALDANAIELFARVTAAGSFAEAARRLGLTRAAVSRRIAAIETLAGQTLFARTTRSLGLTEAGRRLAQRAGEMHVAANAARGALQASRAGLAGRLRISATPSFGRAVLVPLLARFRMQHPQVRFELMFTERRIDLLRDQVDVAFRITRKPPGDWVAQPVLPFVVIAVAAPAHGRRTGSVLAHPRDLAAQTMLLPAAGADTVPLLWRHAASGRSARVEVTPAITSEDIDGLVALARAGGGVALAPRYCVQADLAERRLVDVLPGWHLPVAEGDAVHALTLAQPTAGEGARALVRFVREALAGQG
jgi:DNA-binding transcriptional LysR family regulator